MRPQKLFTRSALAAAVALLSSANTYAAGFQLNEFSAAGLGRAFSGEGAMIDTPASASRNPAVLSTFDRPALSVGGIYIDPGVDITGTSPTGRSLNAHNIAPSALIPNLHYVQPLNDRWSIGASATSNYGLATEFSDDYTAGAFGGTTDLMTANFNLSTAYRLNPQWSFGLGVNAVYAKAKIERYAGELGALVGQPANTMIADLKGHTWGYGWNAGILYQIDERNRYALTYRSEVKLDFKGDYSSALPPSAHLTPIMGTIFSHLGLPAGSDGQIIPGKLSMTLPAMLEVSGYNRVAPQWAIHYSLAYTTWSQFKELKATNNANDTLFQKDEQFHDAYRMALGATYYYDDNWTFRGGVAFDATPVPADHRSISIPDQNRAWLSGGFSYAFNRDLSVDVGASYMHGSHVNFKEGPYQFRSVGKAWLYGANVNYAF
ncbi:long-chain fatty acid transporter FadL [Edwardsiella hoshinae]|uniref:Long-chain fatty acid transport protein n=1 Tax=Edwardsiella hoshinae TaxID=93378 RepID=A0A376DB68_9GAMM|nr:long-chain fatty acid transporter FadL [Edwardsiella hoshinae]QPR27757.1 long-chain fatty acid transporter FadL [Edwardsiella hoshinae]STC86118.1 Outer membrane flp protein [Edwardsiella hoshinae]